MQITFSIILMSWQEFLEVVATENELTTSEKETLFCLLPTEYTENDTKTISNQLGYTYGTINQKIFRICEKFSWRYNELWEAGGRRRITLRKILVKKYLELIADENAQNAQNYSSVNFIDVKDSNETYVKIERCIEFPPEYWEAGTSILSYFNHVLIAKYPSKKIKVRIEQEGLMLRMVIDTLTGEKEEIEKTFDEYGMVVTGKIQPENFLADPLEVMALKNKLEIAALEVRQATQLLNFTRDNSQQRIESLEIQVSKLHSIIENGLRSGKQVFGVISKMSEREKYNLSNARFGGGFATEGGFQVGGNLIDFSSVNNLADAAQDIQELLQQLQSQGVSIEDAKQQAANDIAKQAASNPTVMGKLVKWGQSLADTAGKTLVSEAVKGVLKLALQMSGISLP